MREAGRCGVPCQDEGVTVFYTRSLARLYENPLNQKVLLFISMLACTFLLNLQLLAIQHNVHTFALIIVIALHGFCVLRLLPHAPGGFQDISPRARLALEICLIALIPITYSAPLAVDWLGKEILAGHILTATEWFNDLAEGLFFLATLATMESLYCLVSHRKPTHAESGPTRA